MKTLVIYSSQTGFTKRYVDWISEELQGEAITLQEAGKKEESYFEKFDAIVYGGWSMAGKTVKLEWFLTKASNWKDKKLAFFCVGASPIENPDIEKNLHDALTDEQRKYIKAFYCPGGLAYDRMKLPMRLMLKSLSAALRRKKNATEAEKKMGEMLSQSYDISDPQYAKAITDYLKK